MKIARTIQELETLESDIAHHVLNTLPDGADEDLFNCMGGYIYQIERDEDMILFPRILGLTDNQMIVEPVDSALKVGEFMMFFQATNNAGGNAVFVPEKIYGASIILVGIMEETRKAFG